MALHVRIGGGDYLVDVGYGDSFRTPLPIPSSERSDVSGAYRLSPDGGELQLDHLSAGHWRPLYRVSLRPRAWNARRSSCCPMHRRLLAIPCCVRCCGARHRSSALARPIWPAVQGTTPPS